MTCMMENAVKERCERRSSGLTYCQSELISFNKKKANSKTMIERTARKGNGTMHNEKKETTKLII